MTAKFSVLKQLKNSQHGVAHNLFSGEQKLLDRGENHYRSDHVQSFTYSVRITGGEIQASMKNKNYKAAV